MNKHKREVKTNFLVGEITFYFSILFLIIFIIFKFIGQSEYALINLHLMFIFWGVNKIFAYFHGSEIRLTYAVKVSDRAPQVVRLLAVTIAIAIVIFGLVGLLKLYFKL